MNYASSALAFQFLADRYQWHYVSDRMSLAVPCGGMVSHRRNAQALVTRIQEDAKRIAAITDVPVFAFGCRSLIRTAYFLTLNHPDAQWTMVTKAGVDLIHVQTGSNEFYLMERTDKKSLSDFLEDIQHEGAFKDFYFHLFPADEVGGEPYELPDGLRSLESAATQPRSG